MIIDKLLTEKYRPKELQGVIGNEDLAKITHVIQNDPWALPNLLLATHSPGTGKTTIAKAICNDLKADVLYLNASDERGIDIIRDKVKEFVITKSFNSNSPKIVHFDEADGLTKDAQDSLRNLMEEYHYNCRFIFTCNNENKIIEPLKSRCMIINLNNPPKDQIIGYLKYIIGAESINMKDIKIETIVDTYYPDIRSMVKSLEQMKYIGNINLKTQNSIAITIYNLVKQKKFTEARKEWLNNSISFRDTLKIFYNLIMEDQTISKNEKVNSIREISEADFKMVMGSDPEITFANMCFELITNVFK